MHIDLFSKLVKFVINCIVNPIVSNRCDTIDLMHLNIVLGTGFADQWSPYSVTDAVQYSLLK